MGVVVEVVVVVVVVVVEEFPLLVVFICAHSLAFCFLSVSPDTWKRVVL
jgi:hypothetical protein